MTRFAGRWTLEDRFESPWQYLAVEVPPGTCALRAELEYERSGAVMDLGCIGAGGFRGWSGGARRSFVITPDAATPGYRPGELEPGTWLVMIGLHRVPPAGADYQLTVTVSARRGELAPEPAPHDLPPLTDRPARRVLPAAAARQWLAGDLHTHTVHSDGVMTVPELARFAAGRGLDFLAITDHNTISHHAELAAAGAAHGIALVPGQEVTTEAGHANVLGDVGWVDFREPPDAWLEAAQRAGGLMSVNHPYGGDLSWTAPMQRRPPLLEVWHWSWMDPRWTLPLSWWLAWDPQAIPVGGSDWHQPGATRRPARRPPGWRRSRRSRPRSWPRWQRAGRRCPPGATGPVLLRVGDELVASEADGTILAGPDGPKARVRGELAKFPAAPGCHRLIDAAGATLALTG